MKNNGQNIYKKFYSNEAAVYQKKRYETTYGRIFKSLHHEIIADLLRPHVKNDSLVLEVACGTGHTSVLLADLGINFIACDLTPAMIKRAKNHLLNKSCKTLFVQTDAMLLPFADASFDIVVSTRFLHLFSYLSQTEILKEMLRILKPGGKILVDFDNWSSRWLFALPYLVYNIFRYHRFAPYSFYNRIGKTKRILKRLNVRVDKIVGIGGTYLVAPGLISNQWGESLGRRHKDPPFRLLAEQFMILGLKK